MTIMGQSISTNEQGLVSLTDLWKVAGCKEEEKPAQWMLRGDVSDFIQAAMEKVVGSTLFPEKVPGRRGDHDALRNRARELRKIGESKGMIKVTLGRNGGTFAHWQIALAYAKFLSPKLHMAVNDIYMRYKMADPSLAVEVVDRVEDPEALDESSES